MNPHLKNLKIEKFPKDLWASSKKFSENIGREFTVEDLQNLCDLENNAARKRVARWLSAGYVKKKTK